MASNLTQDTVPYIWVSANDDVIYTFSFNPYLIDQVYTDAGNLQISLANDFDVTPIVGEYIYIQSNVYNGTYKILSVTGTSFATVDTPYISTITSNTYFCYHLRVPTFSVYKGFDTGESYETELPYTKLVDIKPSVVYSETTGLPYIEINLKAYTKRMFTITSNTVANSIDYSMFNAVRITWDGITTFAGSTVIFNFVLNSAITNEELLYAISYGVPLYPISKPLVSTSGTSFYTVIDIVTSGVPRVIKYINGVKQ